jgi:hypothetical protein
VMTGEPMKDGYPVRLVGVFATHWRYAGASAGAAELDLGDRLQRFYAYFADQLPRLLAHRRQPTAEVRFGEQTAAELGVNALEFFVFALPFPADQVVAALTVDFDSPDLNTDPGPAAGLLAACSTAELSIGGKLVGSYLDDLLAVTGAIVHRPASSRTDSHQLPLPLERHQLVLIGSLDGASPPSEATVNSLMHGPRPLEFTTFSQPVEMNRQSGSGALLTRDVSLIYGYEDDVENSIFLTTVQAVGTAFRFEQIWQDAYYHVKEFQARGQASEAGSQTRAGLETLADEMGNLELDLAFSVLTAADLGLRIPSAAIDSFHQALYEVMQIRTRANTVSEMFLRLGGSIRSELTAIQSRERLQEEARRMRGARAAGLLTFLAVPLTFFLGYFGMNASQVHPGDSIWNWRDYWSVYLCTGGLAVVPLIAFVYLYGIDLLKKRPRPAAAAPAAGPLPKPAGAH